MNNYFVGFILVFAMTTMGGCASSSNKGDNSTGLQLGFTDSAKAVFSLFTGGATSKQENTKPCRVAPSFAGFNNMKNKNDKDLCNEEQLKQLDPYIGTYRGKLSGSDQGEVELNVSKTSGITGMVNSKSYGQFKVYGSYVLDGDVLIINTTSMKAIAIKGRVSKDGNLTGTWSGKNSKANGLISASLSK